MSAAVVHHPRTILPKFNFLLAGGAVVLSIIAITDNVGSNTATVTKPAAVTATVQKPGAGTARPEHASKVATATVAAVAPAVVPRLMDESRLASEIGTKVVAAASAACTSRLNTLRARLRPVGRLTTSAPPKTFSRRLRPPESVVLRSARAAKRPRARI